MQKNILDNLKSNLKSIKSALNIIKYSLALMSILFIFCTFHFISFGTTYEDIYSLDLYPEADNSYAVWNPATGTYPTVYVPGYYYVEENYYDYYNPHGPGYYLYNPYGPGYNGTSYEGTYGYGPNYTSGWIKVSESDYVYRYSNGTYAHDNFDQIDGSWYYFDSNNLMHKGWLYRNGYWYYMLPDGKMATSSWNDINGEWYYFNGAGIMQTGYIILDNTIYYSDSSGARVQSGYNPDGHYFDDNGVMIR